MLSYKHNFVQYKLYIYFIFTTFMFKTIKCHLGDYYSYCWNCVKSYSEIFLSSFNETPCNNIATGQKFIPWQLGNPLNKAYESSESCFQFYLKNILVKNLCCCRFKDVQGYNSYALICSLTHAHFQITEEICLSTWILSIMEYIAPL